ncbi:hypothetical protein LCGC14_1727220 [marine sediment metagenome]|uniref:Uncharacterized protein n=1 Tax=marine sediment metagenome TaxID=412755 RepID=A0A0F9HAG0_9ZZZZ
MVQVIKRIEPIKTNGVLTDVLLHCHCDEGGPHQHISVWDSMSGSQKRDFNSLLDHFDGQVG